MPHTIDDIRPQLRVLETLSIVSKFKIEWTYESRGLDGLMPTTLATLNIRDLEGNVLSSDESWLRIPDPDTFWHSSIFDKKGTSFLAPSEANAAHLLAKIVYEYHERNREWPKTPPDLDSEFLFEVWEASPYARALSFAVEKRILVSSKASHNTYSYSLKGPDVDPAVMISSAPPNRQHPSTTP